jgi:hypothetical protein
MKYVPGGVACEFCDQPVDPDEPGTWRRISGWVERRAQGGSNAVKYITTPTAYAHANCLKSQRKPEQPDLFEEWRVGKEVLA